MIVVLFQSFIHSTEVYRAQFKHQTGYQIIKIKPRKVVVFKGFISIKALSKESRKGIVCLTLKPQ